MASLRLHLAHTHNGGGYETFSVASSSSDQQHGYGCLSRPTRSFPGQLSLKDHRLHHQRMAQSHRSSSVSAATWPAGDSGRVNRTSEYSSSFDHLIPTSDLAYAAAAADDNWTEEISKFATKKRIVDKEEDSSKKLDRWMRDSVVEIVNNIGEAPFLVHIYSEDDESRKESSSSKKGEGGGGGIRLVKEKADAESWPFIRGRWEGGSNPIPNGVILVEELKTKEVDAAADKKMLDDAKGSSQANYTTSTSTSTSTTTNQLWGVLIQAKRLDYTACYILKTCRVQNFLGFCTHFCLVRVECFVESAEIQLMKLWLQR